MSLLYNICRALGKNTVKFMYFYHNLQLMEALSRQVMHYTAYGLVYKTLTMSCRAGIRRLLTLAHGFMLHVTMKTVL